jgi:acyl carrier protein
MTQSEIETFIIDHWKQRAEEQGREVSMIGASTTLLQSDGVDSLDLAILVGRLEEYTGLDPFATAVPQFQTIRDLARLYAG